MHATAKLTTFPWLPLQEEYLLSLPIFIWHAIWEKESGIDIQTGGHDWRLLLQE
jgi:hypothetical protein